MKVAELQARLVEFPEDAEVYVRGDEAQLYTPVVYQDDAHRIDGAYPIIIEAP